MGLGLGVLAAGVKLVATVAVVVVTNILTKK